MKMQEIPERLVISRLSRKRKNNLGIGKLIEAVDRNFIHKRLKSI